MKQLIKRWQKWSLPTKFSIVGTILGLALSIIFYIFPYSPTPQVELPVLPGDSGWILIGDFDTKKQIYTRGPLYKVIESNYPDLSLLPRKGEIIELTAERNIVIANYQNAGTTDILQPPWQENILDTEDYTDIQLAKGSQIEVRDISLGKLKNMPAVVWIRIGYPPNTQ